MTERKKYVQNRKLPIDKSRYSMNNFGYYVCNDKEGYASNSKFHVIGKINPYSTENIKQYLKDNNKKFVLKEAELYVSPKHKLKLTCSVCGQDFLASWVSIKIGCVCGCESGQKVSHLNCLSAKRPDLIKYLINESDGLSYTAHSSKRIDVACPICKFKKSMVINTLSRTGFSCGVCNDGFSIPNKFSYAVLMQLGISFQSEKVFEWSDLKRYDIYIESMSTIIECHGEQHYKENGCFNTKLAYIENNDKYKMELALKNGILNYIIVDCRRSDLDWLKENFITQLSIMNIDMSGVNWEAVFLSCKTSIMSSVINRWNNKLKTETKKDIAREFGLHISTISDYIKIGISTGICVKHDKVSTAKPLYQFDLNWNLIKQWDCGTNLAEKELGFKNLRWACISSVSNEKYGFNWSYEKYH